MLLDAEVGRRPVAREPVGGVTGSSVRRRTAAAVNPDDAAIRSMSRFCRSGPVAVSALELEIAPGRHSRAADDGHLSRGRRHGRQLGARPVLRDPAAVDQHVAAAGEPERRHHVVPDASAMHLVVDQTCALASYSPDRSNAAIAQRVRVAVSSRLDRRLPRCDARRARSGFLLVGAVPLPVAQATVSSTSTTRASVGQSVGRNCRRARNVPRALGMGLCFGAHAAAQGSAAFAAFEDKAWSRPSSSSRCCSSSQPRHGALLPLPRPRPGHAHGEGARHPRRAVGQPDRVSCSSATTSAGSASTACAEGLTLRRRVATRKSRTAARAAFASPRPVR